MYSIVLSITCQKTIDGMLTSPKYSIAMITIVVHDYDEAIQFYTKVLGFELVEDTVMSETKRWVVINPTGSKACQLLLAKAASETQTTAVGNQTGGRVGFFLYTVDIESDFARLSAAGVHFVRPISHESFGKVTVFADLYGNLWDLIQPPNLAVLI
jgi:catechol 2,3-dioxygenase-like lactoylglutathione lyase family enzyme